MLTALVWDEDAGDPSARQTALALHSWMSKPDSGFKPILISRNRLDDLPHLPARGMLNHFRIWRWVRAHERLLIIAIGNESLKLAGRIAKLRRKDATFLAWVMMDSRVPDIQPRSLARFQLCICASNHCRDALQAICQSEVIVSAPGIDTVPYELQKKDVQPDRVVFGMAESLMPDSGALLLIRAISALWQHQDIPAWEIRLFGAGSRFDEIMAEARKLGVLSRISILGTQPLPEVTRHCHAWIASGISDTERPETLWAGFAARLPVICAMSALHSERVWDDSAILPVSPDNPQELAAAMLTLMRDGSLARTVANAGAQMAPKITFDAMAARICSTLNDKIAPFKIQEKSDAKSLTD